MTTQETVVVVLSDFVRSLGECCADLDEINNITVTDSNKLIRRSVLKSWNKFKELMFLANDECKFWLLKSQFCVCVLVETT